MTAEGGNRRDTAGRAQCASRAGTGQEVSLTTFTLLNFLVSTVAGFVGALLGLGGGVFLVPALTLLFGVSIGEAVGASAVSVIATSSGAAVAYLRDHITNIRIGMLLEVGTTTGALTGALIAGLLNPRYLYFFFGVLLLYNAYLTFRARRQELPEGVVPDRLALRLRLQGAYRDRALDRTVEYTATRTLPGLLVMYASGMVAGLLGIGAGAFKVLAMDQIMRLPMKVSTATSNFMIGVTAAASAAIYFARGQVNPAIAAPVALGVLLGASLGTRVMNRMRSRTLRVLFAPVLGWIAVQMLWKGWVMP
ncbi:sulfite exporter TauE/SafE family protein [Caldinitratiruptor microaerophilus]|nr:sulfite exporter TauE/SafE family protein [Caldinitratiruptor microaerophilus]